MEHKKYIIELNRGVMILAVLSSLKNAKYSLQLVKYLEDEGYPIAQNTLYPMLRRLTTQGILVKDTRYEGGRMRNYYYLTDEGTELLKNLENEYIKQTSAIKNLMRGNNE